jgi:Zinc carboxypeptidase
VSSTQAREPFPVDELLELERLAERGASGLECRRLCEVEVAGRRLPVLALMLGNPSPEVPVIGIFGGVHGLERIGAEVVLAYLHSLVARLRWDTLLHRQLEGLRMVFMPVVNPGGVLQGTRANPQGVDLMRNAPVEASGGAPFLLGGQRLSARLPWFRGVAGSSMQPESRALCELVQCELLSHRFAITVDCHSGFGLSDRIWFPYAHTARPIEHLPEIHALAELLDQTHAQHRYVFEPQSRQYLTHGDLWDHLYMQACQAPDRMLLPLTLEMGSWLWVKKNPRQMFSRHGIFNPLIGHRQQRVLRRHLAWLDFVARAATSASRWLPQPEQRHGQRERALLRWYRRPDVVSA